MYKITRSYPGFGPLTVAQRTSGKFAEEPTLLGHTLRRNGAPLVITDAQYKHFIVPIKQLENAGAIKIEKVAEVAPVVSTPIEIKTQEEEKPTLSLNLSDTATPELKDDVKVEAKRPPKKAK